MLLILLLAVAADDVPQIRTLKAQERSLLDDLDDALVQKRVLDKKEKRLAEELTSLRAELQTTEQAFVAGAVHADALRKQARVNVRLLQETSHTSLLRALLAADSLPDALRRARVLTRWLTRDLHRLTLSLSDLRALEERRADYARNLDYARDVESTLTATRESVAADAQNITALLASVREERAAHEHAFYERKELDAARDLPTDSIVSADLFFALHGHLPWPLRGSIQSPFGRFQSSGFGAQLARSGIIVAARGPVAVVADGQVTFAGTVPSVGSVVVVEHSPYFATVYSGIDSLNAHVGKALRSGDVIGRASGSYTFEIRRGVMPEDPLPWLSP